MAEYLLLAAGFVLATVAVGLVRILRGASATDSMMALQLLGTGGIAALLLLGAATGADAVVDVALTLALLAAFASFAFVKAAGEAAGPDAKADSDPWITLLNCFRWPLSRRGYSFFWLAPWGCCDFPTS